MSQKSSTLFPEHQCGASLISSCWVVTSAKCVNDFEFTGYNNNHTHWLRAEIGSRNRTSIESPNKQILFIKNVITHERYKTFRRGTINDIALIQAKF